MYGLLVYLLNLATWDASMVNAVCHWAIGHYIANSNNALRTSRSKSYISHGSFRPGVMNHWIMYFESTPQPILQVTTPGICQFLIGNPHLKKKHFYLFATRHPAWLGGVYIDPIYQFHHTVYVTTTNHVSRQRQPDLRGVCSRSSAVVGIFQFRR